MRLILFLYILIIAYSFSSDDSAVDDIGDEASEDVDFDETWDGYNDPKEIKELNDIRFDVGLDGYILSGTEYDDIDENFLQGFENVFDQIFDPYIQTEEDPYSDSYFEISNYEKYPPDEEEEFDEKLFENFNDENF